MQKKCKMCQTELNKRQNYYCSNKCKLSDGSLRSKPKPKLEEGKYAVCKATGKEFKDYLNMTGALSKYLNKLGIEHENALDHYEVKYIQKDPVPTYKCRYCDWTVKDVNNKSGWVTVHLKKVHDVDPSEHIQNYPEDSHMFVYSPNKVYHQNILVPNTDSNIECKECGKMMKRLTVTHLKLHDMTPQEYRDKHGVEVLSCVDVIRGMKESYEQNFDSINKFVKRSKMEKEMCEYLDSLNVEYETGNRSLLKTAEIDIYIPSRQLAIEMNGLYWHSEKAGNKTKTYHENKTLRCESVGVRLMQVFEDEWRSKQDIVKSKVKNALKLDNDRTYARSCTAMEINAKTKSAFLNKHHIQGDDRSQIRLGLYKDKELIAVMTFCHNRSALGQKKAEGQYELSRFCSSVRVVGGASKLLKLFLKLYSPTKVTTYADARYTSANKDNLYSSLGFSYVGKSKPSYWYTKNYHSKVHRYTYNKRRLMKDYGFSADMTEFQMAHEIGLDRVWDCGAHKYELKLNK